MPTINGLFTGSTGVPLAGNLFFTLLQAVTDSTTNPDTIRFPVVRTFAIAANGIVAVDVPESQTFGVPYQIRFEPTVLGFTITEFAAIVPNVGTVEFSALVPTGITNANLDTGALRVASLMVSDPILAPLVRRSSTFVAEAIGQTVTRRWFIPKPFPTGALINRLVAFSLSGATNWTFAVGQTLSNGSDAILTVQSFTTNTQAGRIIRTQQYAVSTPASALAFYIEITPGVGSTAINASFALNFTETSL